MMSETPEEVAYSLVETYLSPTPTLQMTIYTVCVGEDKKARGRICQDVGLDFLVAFAVSNDQARR
jgi:hypothetical protein